MSESAGENRFDLCRSQYGHIPWSTVTRGHFRARFRSFNSTLADAHGSNAWVVPFTLRDECVLTQKQDGQWWIPGGTVEPGEHWRLAARREISEEIGADILEIHPFGIYDCVSSAATPLRPHLPHPRSIRVVSWATVEIVTAPSEPDGAEGIVGVHILPYPQAVSLLQQDYPELGDLYKWPTP